MANQKLNFSEENIPSSKTRLYRIYRGMNQRCYNSTCSNYKNYGGRGIKLCQEWINNKGFQNFYDWSISHGYAHGLTIDRIDNDGNYSPDNCQWVTKSYNSFKQNVVVGKKYSELSSVRETIRRFMVHKNINSAQMAKAIGMNKQAFSNKLYRDDMPVKDLIKILSVLDCRLVIDVGDDLFINLSKSVN